MGTIGTVILGLLLVNGLLLAVVGLVLLGNPFKLEILATVAIVNATGFFLAALFTSDSPGAALQNFGTKLIPFLVLAAGCVALFLVQAKPRPRKRA